MSGKMIKNLIRANKLEEKFQCYGLYAKDIDTIIGFIKGEAGGLPPDKLFLSEVSTSHFINDSSLTEKKTFPHT